MWAVWAKTLALALTLTLTLTLNLTQGAIDLNELTIATAAFYATPAGESFAAANPDILSLASAPQPKVRWQATRCLNPNPNP